jgi:uncharacterized protein with HEPN domain
MWRDPATLLDIAKAIRLIQEFKHGVDCESFMADRKTQAAILYQITILGEAIKRLSSEFRESHSYIPWQEIACMRNKLVHAYDKVILEEVWKVTEEDLPQLKAWIDPLLPRKED